MGIGRAVGKTIKKKPTATQKISKGIRGTLPSASRLAELDKSARMQELARKRAAAKAKKGNK
jgi:hypothetical protein